MALTLSADVDASSEVIHVTGTLPADLADGYPFRIGDEKLTFERYEPKRTLMAGTPAEIPGAPIPSLLVWIVRRGQGGSTPASHLSGASLLGVTEAAVSGGTVARPAPWPSGGGGGAVDSVNGQTGVVVLDAGDIDTATAPGPTVEDTLAALAAVPTLAAVLNAGASVPDGFTITGPDGTQFQLNGDGWEINGKNSLARFSLNADGSVRLWGKNPGTPGSPGPELLFGADGGAEFRGLTRGIEITPDGDIKLADLPTSDPAVDGALWNDGGTVVFSGSAKLPIDATPLAGAPVIIAKDGEIVRASVSVVAGTIILALFDALGDPAASFTVGADGVFSFERADFANGISLGADGSASISSGSRLFDIAADGQVTVGVTGGSGPRLRIAADGGIDLTNADGSGSISITAGGGLAMAGSFGTIDITSTAFRIMDLPTADPAIARALWNDGGTVKVSAG